MNLTARRLRSDLSLGPRLENPRWHRGRKVSDSNFILEFGPFLLFAGQWIAYADENGIGWAQPDLFLVSSEALWLFEVKLKQHPQARDQLDNLYGPLLEHIFDRPQRRVEVFKHFGPSGGEVKVLTTVESVLALGPGHASWRWDQ